MPYVAVVIDKNANRFYVAASLRLETDIQYAATFSTFIAALDCATDASQEGDGIDWEYIDHDKLRALMPGDRT